MRKNPWYLEDRGAGTTIAIGLLGVALSLTLLLANLERSFVTQARLELATDNAAIAGADALRGLVSGVPCEQAKLMLEASNFQLVSCSVQVNDVLVQGRSGTHKARARAGEPG
ncbi:MAG: hypothetical protein RIS26_191 [Actinomycetota bacterium]|jgi:secretion/DNA translocation related TadE-like protein